MSEESSVLTRFLDELTLLLSALDERVEALDGLTGVERSGATSEARGDLKRLSRALTDLAEAFEVSDIAALARDLTHALSTGENDDGPVAIPGARDALAYMRWRRSQIRREGRITALDAQSHARVDLLEMALVGETVGEAELARAIGNEDDALSDLSPEEREVLRTFATTELRIRSEDVDAHQLAEAAAAMARDHAHWAVDGSDGENAERLNEIRQDFFSETDEDLREFSALLSGYGRDPELASGQLHAVMLIAHKIKGTAPTIGFPELTQLASYLEWTVFAYQRQPQAAVEVVSAVLARFLDLFESTLDAARADEAPGDVAVEEARRLYDAAANVEDVTTTARDGQVHDSAPERSTPSSRLVDAVKPTVREPLLQVDANRLETLMIHLSGLAVNRGALAAAHARVSAAQASMTTAINRLHEKSLQIADVYPLRAGLAPLPGPITRSRLQAPRATDPEIRATTPRPAMIEPSSVDRDDDAEAATAMRSLNEAVADLEMLSASLTGELVQLDQLIEGQDIVISNIQQDATRMRLAPLADLAPRLEIVANYLASALGKRVKFRVEGEMTELDRSLMRALAEPLNQLVRNAISHGIETPEARVDAGKADVGSVWVRAYYAGSEVIIDVGDDGRGINEHALVARAIGIDAMDRERARTLTREEALRLVFHPGISALDRPGALAGSGIGLHEVETIVRSLRGEISVASTSNQGSLFRIRVPLTLTVLPAMEVMLGDHVFTVPFSAVARSLTDIGPNIQRAEARDADQTWDGDARALTRYLLALPETEPGLVSSDDRARADHEAVIEIPAYSLAERLGVLSERPPEAAIVAQRHGKYVALLVDGFGAMRETMVRPLPSHLRRRVIRGVTIRADDGAAAMLIDVGEVADELLAGAVQAPPAPPRPAPGKPVPRVMIVDDSVTIRRALDQMLSAAGFETTLAADGYEALEMMEAEAPRVIILDVEMPRLDGYETLKILRATSRYDQTRVMMLTSRAAARHEALARELGADDYFVKPCPQDMLVSAVRRLMADSENA